MYDFHNDVATYFDFQYQHSRDYIVPLAKNFLNFGTKLRILEIGSAEAGVLKAFTELGHECVGVEIDNSRVENAKRLMIKEINEGLVSFFSSNIFDVSVNDLGGKFDLIILKDVIEHIHGREKLYDKFKEILKFDGIVFIAMPPWRMPFGGHQQMLHNKIYSRIPYFHLLPFWITKLLLKWDKYPHIDAWKDIRQTKISINGFKKEVKKNNFDILHSTLYLINPNYKFKFKLEPRKQFRLIACLPYFRDFLTTTVYYIIKQKQ